MEKKFINCANAVPNLCPHYENTDMLKAHQLFQHGDDKQIESDEFQTILNSADILCADCDSFSPKKR